MRRLLFLTVLGSIAPVTLLAQTREAAVPVSAPRPAGFTPSTGHLTPEQQRKRLDFVRASDIEGARRRLHAGAVGTTVHTSGDQQTNYVIVRRMVSSEVELHSRWDDFVIVRAGRGAIEFGERSEGIQMRAPGEWRGGTLAPTYRVVVGPGDIVRIPAAVPHRFEVGTEPLEYLLLKQRHGELPLMPAGLPRERK